MRKYFIFIALGMMSHEGFILRAQDAHYWTNQFGPIATLLSGAVVGGVNDNSASYYNAAGLAISDSSGGIAIQTNAIGIERVMFKNGAGKGKDLVSNELMIPFIITGRLKYKIANKLPVGFFLADKHNSSFNSSARTDGYIDILSDFYSKGLEEYISQFKLSYNLYELNAGCSIGYRFNNKWSFGLTNIGAYRSSVLESSHLARMLNTSNFQLSSYNRLQYISFENVRTLFKAGLMYRSKRMKLGMTLTSPSIYIWGRSTLSMDILYQNIYGGTFQDTISFVANDRQNIKKTNYLTPFSLAVGGEFNCNNMLTLYTTFEYFTGLKPYVLVQPESKEFVRPSNVGIDLNSFDYLKIEEGRRPIVNGALGIKWQYSSKLGVYVGARTDFYSATLKRDNILQLTNSRWNLYHVSSGVSLRRRKYDLNVGVLFSFGKTKKLPQYINISSPRLDSDSPLQGHFENNVTAYYKALQVMVGYVYYIK